MKLALTLELLHSNYNDVFSQVFWQIQLWKKLTCSLF